MADDETTQAPKRATQAQAPDPSMYAIPEIDEGHPGGAYLLPDGRMVNAEGQELDRAGKPKG